jgi:hypothetical protein
MILNKHLNIRFILNFASVFTIILKNIIKTSKVSDLNYRFDTFTRISHSRAPTLIWSFSSNLLSIPNPKTYLQRTVDL